MICRSNIRCKTNVRSARAFRYGHGLLSPTSRGLLSLSMELLTRPPHLTSDNLSSLHNQIAFPDSRLPGECVNEIKVVCGTCKADAEIVSDTNSKVAVCPTCGQRDSLERAEQIAAEHHMQDAIANLQNGTDKVLKGKDALKVTPERRPRRSFKWHAAPS